MLNPAASEGPHQRPYVGNQHVQWNEIRLDDLPTMSVSAAELDRFRVRSGDLLVCEGGDIGRTAVWTSERTDCCYQKALHRLRPRRPSEVPRFFYYVMAAAAGRGAFHADGNQSTIIHLTGEKLRRQRFPFPPSATQQRIADFLDRKTGVIDDLIEKKERLVALLREKRQALITQAVTKGLDPKVPMKESGQTFLPKIPVAWEIVPLRHLLSFGPKNGISPPPAAAGGVLSFSISAVRAGGVNIEGNEKWVDLAMADAKPYLVRPGDLLLMRGNGSLDLVGTVGLVARAPEGCIYPDILMAMRPNERVLGDFLVAALNAPYVREQVTMLAKTSNGTFKVSGADVRTLCIAVPPAEEQAQLVGSLGSGLAGLDQTISLTDASVAKLREYRQALITAAVTGQLDVARDDAA